VIPHAIWIALWGIAALIAAIANWFATLVQGQSPASLHNFLALYVRYVTQVYAYFYLAANPYPAFDGRSGYPVEVEIAPPQRQNRWGVGFRLILAIPALILAAAFLGGGRSYPFSGALLDAAALLGWFVILARARMPRGLRDAAAWSVGFGAHLWSYLLLLTQSYPNPDPVALLGELPDRDDPVTIANDEDLRRSRLTVFFRLLLALPHLVWLTLWTLIALLAVIASWFATLFSGEPPAALHRFLSAYLRYRLHVYAFLFLVANPFPGFVGEAGSYPIEARIAAPARQNRWIVGFRVLLAIPALFLSTAYGSVLVNTALLGWFASLATARFPLGLRRAAVQALRYDTQLNGYMLLLTDAYPYSGPCAERALG
jgi:Domain of unknown function (DUF4389)